MQGVECVLFCHISKPLFKQLLDRKKERCTIRNAGLNFENYEMIVIISGVGFKTESTKNENELTLKAPTTTTADGIYKYFFIAFQRK